MYVITPLSHMVHSGNLRQGCTIAHQVLYLSRNWQERDLKPDYTSQEVAGLALNHQQQFHPLLMQAV